MLCEYPAWLFYPWPVSLILLGCKQQKRDVCFKQKEICFRVHKRNRKLKNELAELETITFSWGSGGQTSTSGALCRNGCSAHWLPGQGKCDLTTSSSLACSGFDLGGHPLELPCLPWRAAQDPSSIHGTVTLFLLSTTTEHGRDGAQKRENGFPARHA